MITGFIGTGNMAGAIIRGMINSGAYKPEEVAGFNRSVNKAEALNRECGMTVLHSIKEVVSACDTVVLAVKPQMLSEVLGDIIKCDITNKLFVSVAAGKPISFYEEYLGESAKIIRIMPNVNARVCASATALCAGYNVTQHEKALVRDMLLTVGTVEEIPEHLFSAFSAVAGASPAFTFMYIDALTDAGVRGGLTRASARNAAASAVYGSAKLALESDAHLMELKDSVCSPGGTTIEGVASLQKNAFTGAVAQAVKAVIDKDKTL